MLDRNVYVQYTCDAYCKAEPNCRYYSFDLSKNNSPYVECYLFEDCQRIDDTVKEFISGHVGCPVACDSDYHCDGDPFQWRSPTMYLSILRHNFSAFCATFKNIILKIIQNGGQILLGH